jgi:hypothetical protein
MANAFAALQFMNIAEQEYNAMPVESVQWIREDNTQVYDLNIPNRIVRGNYPVNEGILVGPPAKRHTLGLVGGNEVSRLAGNPQDIESDLRGLTRPLTKANDREYKPLLRGQERIEYDNRKTRLAIDLRPVHLKEYQMWGYAPVYAPQPLQKQTCGRPEKY